MILFAENVAGVKEGNDTRHPEIAIIAAQPAPGDEVPVEGVEKQSNGFDVTFAGLAVHIFISDTQDVRLFDGSHDLELTQTQV